MKKIVCYLMVLAAVILFTGLSYGQTEKKEPLKVEIKVGKSLKDSTKAGVELSDEIVKKLSNDELVEIIKYKDKLAHTRALANDSNDPPALVIFIVFGSFVLLMFIPYYFRMKKTRSLHAMVTSLAEKGHPIPQEIFYTKKRTFRNDFQKGILLVAFGFGLSLVLIFVKVSNNYWTIGLIPVLLGFGYMISYKFIEKNNNKTEIK